jgi:hypothetical protein
MYKRCGVLENVETRTSDRTVPSAVSAGSLPQVPELEGTFPVVLYFGTSADRDDFIALVREAKPGLVAKRL